MKTLKDKYMVCQDVTIFFMHIFRAHIYKNRFLLKVKLIYGFGYIITEKRNK